MSCKDEGIILDEVVEQGAGENAMRIQFSRHSADRHFKGGTSPSWTCYACGHGGLIDYECVACGTPRMPVRTVLLNSMRSMGCLRRYLEISSVQGVSEVPFVPSEAREHGSIVDARTVSYMEMPVAAGGSASQLLPSLPLAESTVSSMTGSIFEETLHIGINCSSELRGINHFPLAESTGSVEVAKEVPTPAPQAQDQLQLQASCLPGQEADGPGVVAGSEGVVWRCDQCRIVNSVRDPTCAQCRTKRHDWTLGTVFFALPSVDDFVKAQLALRFIASNFPLSRSARIYECSALVEALCQHGPNHRTIAEVGIEALAVVSWSNLSFIEQSEGFKVLYNLMNQRADSEKVALHGCGMTERSCIVSAAYQNIISQTDGLRAIVTVLRIHAKHVEIARAACSTLYHLAVDNVENQSKLAASGAVDDILRAVSVNVQDAEVARRGCAALDVLLTPNTVPTNAGDVAIIMATVHVHGGVMDITEMVCRILWRLTDGKNAQNNCKAIMEGDGFKMLLCCLRSNLLDLQGTAVVSHLCIILNNILCLNELRDAVVEAGAIDITLELLMTLDRNNENVVCLVCSLIVRLAFNHVNRLAICMGGAIERILSMMKHCEHGRSLGEKTGLLNVLQSLTVSDETNLVVIDAGGFNLILHALVTCRNNGVVVEEDPINQLTAGFAVWLHLMNAQRDSASVARNGCTALLQALKSSNLTKTHVNEISQLQLFKNVTEIIAKVLWSVLFAHYKSKGCFIAACEALGAVAAISNDHCAVIAHAGQTNLFKIDVSLMLALENFRFCPRVQEPGCMLLRHLLRIDGFMMPTEHNDFVMHAVDMLHTHTSRVMIVEDCCAILHTLGERSKFYLCYPGRIKVAIVLVLHNYITSEFIVDLGSRILLILLRNKKNIEVVFGDQAIVEIMLAILLAYEENDPICGLVWQILNGFVLIDSASKPIITDRIIRQLLEIATRGTAAVADKVCGVMMTISPAVRFSHFETVEDIRYVANQLLALLERHISRAVVARCVCGALRNLSSTAMSADSFVELILSAMGTHPADPVVATEACWALRYLTRNPANAAVIAISGEILRATVAALRDHARQEVVCVQSCAVLNNLMTAGGGNTALLSDNANVIIPILLIALRGKRWSPALKSGFLLLQKLTTGNPENQAVMVKNDGIETLLSISCACLSTTIISLEALEWSCNLLWMIVAENVECLKRLRRAQDSRDILLRISQQFGDRSGATAARRTLDAMELLPKLVTTQFGHVFVGDCLPQ